MISLGFGGAALGGGLAAGRRPTIHHLLPAASTPLALVLQLRPPRPSVILANWAIFSTRFILPTTSRTWASSYSSPELLTPGRNPRSPSPFPPGWRPDVVGRPAYAAGEVGDLDGCLAVHLALHVPVEHLRLVVRESRVQHFQLLRG